MPRPRRRHPQTNSILNNALAVVQNPNGGPCCNCHLTVKHLPDKSQGSASLRVMATFEGFDEPENVLLWFPLESVEQMTIRFNETRIPSAVADQLRHSVQPPNSQFLILNLCMHAPGVVIVPKPGIRITPAETDRPKVAAFASITQATEIHIFVPTTDQTASLEQSLQHFTDAVNTGDISSISIDLNAARGPRGAKVAKSRVFQIAEPPPPYYGDREGKRTRPESPDGHTSPPNKRQAADLSSSGASANPNPIFDSSSPRPSAITDFRETLRSSTDAFLEQLLNALDARLETKLDTKVCAILPSALPAALDAQLETHLRATLPSVLSSAIHTVLRPNLTEETLTRVLRATIGPLIEDRLPELVQEYIDAEGPLDHCLDTATTQFDERVEDAQLEIQIAKDACIDEIEAAGEEALKNAEDAVEYVKEESMAAARRVASQNRKFVQQKPGAALAKGLDGSQDSFEDLTFHRRRSACRSGGSGWGDQMSEAAAAGAEKRDEQADGDAGGGSSPKVSVSEKVDGDAGGGSSPEASASQKTDCAASARDSAVRQVQPDDNDGAPNLLNQPAASVGNAENDENSARQMTMLTDAKIDTGFCFVPGSTTEADTETDDDSEL